MCRVSLKNKTDNCKDKKGRCYWIIQKRGIRTQDKEKRKVRSKQKRNVSVLIFIKRGVSSGGPSFLVNVSRDVTCKIYENGYPDILSS